MAKEPEQRAKLSRNLKSALDKAKAWARKLWLEVEWVLGERAARVLVMAATICVAVVLLVLFLEWYVAPTPTEPTERKDLVQATGILLAALAGLSGLYFTWRNLNQTRQTTQRTLELTERGQITERFTRVIDQLGATDDDGNKRLEVRLGGIYALERIARDSKDDRGPIVEVLTAYVREHAPWPPKRPKKRGEENAFISPPDSQASRMASNEPQQANANEEDPSPEPDVQVVLTVLGRLPHYYGNGQVESPNLQQTDLRGAGLAGARLEGADLAEAHLEGAMLDKVHLEGVDLREAHLEGARLVEAHLERAQFIYTHLEGALLAGACLEGARLVGARLERAFLLRAHLEGADLGGAHLEGARLVEAHLERAGLAGARLEGADLAGARLEGADLAGARLEGAGLRGAIGLTQEQIEEAFGDGQTELPEGLDRPAHWDQDPDDEQPNRSGTIG